MTDITTFKLRINGSVQGVGFRAWAIGEATSRKIDGWVRNRSDGTVEAVISGDARAVSDLLRAARHGPAMARVDRVHSEPAEYDGLEGFRIAESMQV
jgi:acylphosphatase